MKTTLILCVIALTTGCTYTGTKTPLNPGEKIVFSSSDRANHFRQASGNDPANGGRFVEITQPTILVTE